MKFSGANVAHVISRGWAAYGITGPYDGISAVEVDPDGMFRALLPVGRDEMFALTAELGGRATNLLFPYSRGSLCAHGLVKASRDPWAGPGTCGCGIDPISLNPVRAL